EDQHCPFALGRTDHRDRGEVRRKAGPGRIFDLGDRVPQICGHLEVLSSRHDDVLSVCAKLETELPECKPSCTMLVRTRTEDAKLAACHRCEHDERSDLDVVGTERVLRTVKLRHAMDHEAIGSDAFDAP